MKCFRILSIINGVILSSNVAATTLTTPTFNSYVDHIFNTYLDFKTPHMQDHGKAYTGDMGSYAIEAVINLHQFMQEMYPEKIPQVLWQFIEVSPMIGVNDLNTEQFA